MQANLNNSNFFRSKISKFFATAFIVFTSAVVLNAQEQTIGAGQNLAANDNGFSFTDQIPNNLNQATDSSTQSNLGQANNTPPDPYQKPPSEMDTPMDQSQDVSAGPGSALGVSDDGLTEDPEVPDELNEATDPAVQDELVESQEIAGDSLAEEAAEAQAEEEAAEEEEATEEEEEATEEEEEATEEDEEGTEENEDGLLLEEDAALFEEDEIEIELEEDNDLDIFDFDPTDLLEDETPF